MNHIDLIKLAHKADLDGDRELADYLDNQLVRIASLKQIIPNIAKGWEKTRRPNYDIDFKSLQPDASNLDTMIKHPTQIGSPSAKFFQAGLKTVKRTPERLVEIEKSIKDAILNIASSDPKIDVAKKKVQSGQKLTADERNSLLNILVRDNKVATRKNDIAVEDIVAVLDNKSPTLTSKEVTTMSNAAKGLAYLGAAGTVGTMGLSAFNAAQQSNYQPGELYNNQQTSPGMQTMPSGMPSGQNSGGSSGGFSGGGGYQGPRYEQPKDESRNYVKQYQPAYVNDQLYGRNGDTGYRTQTYYREYPTFNDQRGYDNESDYYDYDQDVQGQSKYQPIGPTQEEPIDRSLDMTTDPAGVTYDSTGGIQEGGQAPPPSYQEPPYPV